MRKPVLLGISNPYPTEALDPRNPGSSGSRLFQMLKSCRPHTTVEEYMSCFDRMNLDPDGVPEGRRTVVALGKKVQKALSGTLHLVIPVPHPSGLCRDYNDPVLRKLVGGVMKELMDGYIGRASEDPWGVPGRSSDRARAPSDPLYKQEVAEPHSGAGHCPQDGDAQSFADRQRRPELR